jgi:hypothetical protein
MFPACQACSGELMSHNTVKNIVANKGNIDYCIEVRQLCLPAPDCPAAPPTSLSVRRTRATCNTICALSLIVSRVFSRQRRRAPRLRALGRRLRGKSLPAVSLTMPVYAQQFAYISNRIRCIKVMTGNGPFLA